MKIYIYIIIISLFIYPLTHFGQNVHGMVYELDKDNKTVPLPGANVYWAGTTVGTTTDSYGHFSIEGVKSITKLVISFVSYVNDTLDIQKISKDSEIEVILRNEKQLEEVRISGRTGAFHSSLEVAHVQNITGVELQKAACCNLSESFETNASVDVAYSDAVTGAKQIELLGLHGKYIQILTEKTPMVRGLASGYGLEYVPGTWMEAISISKGTSSVVDGFEAITGQISVDYKKPDRGEKFFFNTIGNSMGKIEANINGRMFIDSAEKISTMLLAHGETGLMRGDYNKDGFSDHPVVKQVNIVNRWKYDPNDKLCLQMSLRGLGEKREGGQTLFDGTIDGLADNYGVLVFSNRYELIAKAGYIFDRPSTSLGFINSYVYHNQDNYIGRNEFFALQNSYYGNLIFESYIGNTNHTYSTGLSYVSDVYAQTFNDVEFDKREFIPGAFFQYTYIIAEKATLILGIRADHHNMYGWFYTPRLNFKYVFPGKYIVRISAGKGYRSPNVLAENSYLLSSSRNLVFTETILQEEAWNYGLTFSKTFKIKKQELAVFAEIFRTDFLNQMIVDQDASLENVYVYNLSGKSYSNIAQIELKYTPIKNWEFMAAYRLSDVKSTTNGVLKAEPLKNSYKAILNTSYNTPKQTWQFDFTAQFNGGGRMPEYSSHSYSSFSPYTIINAQITKKFKVVELYFGGENLTDFTQKDPVISADSPYSNDFDASTIWGPIVGRKFYLGIRLKIE